MLIGKMVLTKSDDGKFTLLMEGEFEDSEFRHVVINVVGCKFGTVQAWLSDSGECLMMESSPGLPFCCPPASTSPPSPAPSEPPADADRSSPPESPVPPISAGGVR